MNRYNSTGYIYADIDEKMHVEIRFRTVAHMCLLQFQRDERGARLHPVQLQRLVQGRPRDD